MTKSSRNATRSGKAWAVVDTASHRRISIYDLSPSKRLSRKLRDARECAAYPLNPKGKWRKWRVIRVEIREVK